MAEETQIVELNDTFYRDGFQKVVVLLASVVLGIALLLLASFYLIMNKPPTQYFLVGDDFRLQPEVPIDQPYLSLPSVLQWTSDTLQEVFTLDFINYNDQPAKYKWHFTAQGWVVYQNQLNNYVDYNTVKSGLLFTKPEPTSAPSVLNQGLLSGRYAWWIQMPLKIGFSGIGAKDDKNIVFQVLVVRVPTKDNLAGVAIDNIIVDTGKQSSDA